MRIESSLSIFAFIFMLSCPLGPITEPASATSVPHPKAIGQWEEINDISPPSPMKGHELVYYPKNETIYLFGGREVYQFSVRGSAWRLLDVRNGPQIRDMPAVLDEKSDTILFRNRTLLWRFDIATTSWSSESAPPYQGYDTYAWDMDPDAGRILMAAGCVTGMMEVWQYGLSDHVWTNISGDGPICGTARIRAVYFRQDGDLYIYGGYNDQTTSDRLYRFNVASRTWALQNTSIYAHHRCLYSLVLNQNLGKLYMFGGWQIHANTYDSTMEYDIATNEWRQISMGSHPSGRMACGNAHDEKRAMMYIFGGSRSFGLVAPNTDDLVNDMWMLQYSFPANPPRAICATHELFMTEDVPLRMDLRDRFFDPDEEIGDTANYTMLTAWPGFTLNRYNGTSLVDLVPPADFAGAGSVTLAATDTTGRTGTETLTVVVEPVNDPPAICAHSPEDNKVPVPEGGSQPFAIWATDADDVDLTAAWYLDRIKLAEGFNFTYQPDFNAAGRHTLKVEVSDSIDSANYNWTVTVANVNRPPVDVNITSPPNGSKFQEGDLVIFFTSANDPDGDELTFRWNDNGRPLGQNRSFSIKATRPGWHNITLQVSDDKDTVNATLEFKVAARPEPAGFLPGFGGPGLLAALIAVMLAWKRKRGA